MTDAELITFARKFRRGILGRRPSTDMCYAVCAPLHALLSMAGVEAELVEVWFQMQYGERNHYFLKLRDGRILDPTADQFGLAPVYLGAIPELYAEVVR